MRETRSQGVTVYFPRRTLAAQLRVPRPAVRLDGRPAPPPHEQCAHERGHLTNGSVTAAARVAIAIYGFGARVRGPHTSLSADLAPPRRVSRPLVLTGLRTASSRCSACQSTSPTCAISSWRTEALQLTAAADGRRARVRLQPTEARISLERTTGSTGPYWPCTGSSSALAPLLPSLISVSFHPDGAAATVKLDRASASRRTKKRPAGGGMLLARRSRSMDTAPLAHDFPVALLDRRSVVTGAFDTARSATLRDGGCSIGDRW